MLAAFAGEYASRVALDLSHVDDYLYAAQAHRLAHDGVLDAWRTFPTSAPLVPMLAMPIAAVTDSVHALVAVQAVGMLAIYLTSAGLIHRLGVTGARAWWFAAAVAVSAPILGYSGLFHFALASTAGFLGAVWAYVASDGLRRHAPSAGFGVALGLLSISRVISAVYIASILAACGLLWLSDRADIRRRLVGTALAAAVALAIATPWWWVNRAAARRYLLSAGYDASSGFAPQRSVPERLLDRLMHTAAETGWVLAVVLVVGLVAAVRRKETRALAAAALLGLLLLGTSSNLGTAFALPLVAVASVVSLAALPRMAALVVAGLLGASGAVLLTGLDTHVAGGPLSASRPLVRQFDGALGCPCSKGLMPSEELYRSVLTAVGGRTPVLVARDDSLLNVNGLAYTAGPKHVGRKSDLLVPPYGDTAVPPGMLITARTVVTGTSRDPYHRHLDLVALERELRQGGFQLTWSLRLSPHNVIEVWFRPEVV